MKTPVKVATALCIASLLAACGGEPDTPEAQDTLIIAQGADAKNLDPHATNDQPSSRVAAQIYSQLVESDREMNIVPGLAESWKSLDDRTMQFSLRKGVKFHNGEEFTADDVEFTLERMLASPAVFHIVNAIDGVTVVDDYTVNITTKEPFGPLLYHLTHTATSMLNEEAVTAAGDSYGQHPIGTGPYQLVDWVVGDRITLKAFDGYYGGKQAIDNLVFRNIPEGTNRAIALETGEVHISYDLEPIDKDTIRNNDKLELVEEASFSVAYLGFNVQKKPFDNVKVRQAFSYAFNADDIIEAVLMGAGSPSNSPIGSKVFGHNPNISRYQQDVAKAKQLLTEAGYPNGFKTSIWTNDNPIRVQIAQVLQAQLHQIGVEASIEVVEWGAFLDGTSRGDHDMYIMGWVAVTGDADYGLYALFHSSTHGGGGNRFFYTNPRVDELLLQARTTVDPEVRKTIYAEIQTILQQEVPSFSIYDQFQNIGMQRNVLGFSMAPAGHHKVRGVSFKQG